MTTPIVRYMLDQAVKAAYESDKAAMAGDARSDLIAQGRQDAFTEGLAWAMGQPKAVAASHVLGAM